MAKASTNDNKFTFSGHDTFHCRHLWLKKGYEFVKKGNKFANEDSVIELGVGKNMVAAIAFWMKAFGIVDKVGNLTDFSHYIFDDEKGKDPYIEDDATLWLLHYQLVTQNVASTYNIIFNEFRKERIEFTNNIYSSFISRKIEGLGLTKISEATISKDFEVLSKMYIRTNSQSQDKEDTFSGILTELNIIKEESRKVYNDKEEKDVTISFYTIVSDDKEEIPEEEYCMVY